MIAWWWLSCATLDGFVFNGIHCSDVDASTCEGADEDWNEVCLTCPEEIDWTRRYAWWPPSAGPIRAVDPSTVTRLRLPTDDGEGELDVVYITGFGNNGRITVLYDHGNYANLEHYAPRIRMLHEAGFAVLSWDYRGYGKSEPDTFPTAEQFLADALLIRDLVDTLAPDPDRVLVYGMSLGAVPAVEQATRRTGCGLVLENPFTSLATISASTTQLSLGEQFFSEGRFDNEAKLSSYTGPLFVMTGAADTLFPSDDVLALAAGAAGPTETWVVPGAAHGVGPDGIPELGFDRWAGRLSDFAQRSCPANPDAR